MTNDQLMTLLPRRTVELVNIIGLPAALTLVELRGGSRLTIPKKPKSDHWLVAHIGMDALTKLAAYYGGERIEIDLCHAVISHKVTVRWLAMTAMFNNGANTPQIAKHYRMTERGVRKIRKRVRERIALS